MDVFYPSLCVNCSTQTLSGVPLCSSCFLVLKFLHGHYCVVCGVAIARCRNVCLGCETLGTYLSELHSVFEYDSASKNMILNLKFRDDLTNVRIYAKWLFAKGVGILERSDLLIPMPLHRVRLFHRKFNQAALLARELGKICHLPCHVFVLKKNKNTRPQSGLPAHERIKNVASSFEVTNPNVISGKVITLIDDVVTTGSSLQECAKVLRQSGAQEVLALTLGRAMCR